MAMAATPLRRILLVEDDPDIREATILLLSDVASFEVRACGSATEALQSAPAFGPDLILLDVMMPGLDGEAAFAAFRQMPETTAAPVIFVTARVQPGEIVKYRELGALGVIPKPFDPDTLAETIQGMWDRHQTSRVAEARRDALTALRQLYAADLPERIRTVEAAAASLQADGWDTQVAASLYEMAHRLAGSAAIYGFPAVSEAAHRIGRFASQHASAQGPVDPRPLLKLVDALVQALEQPAPLS
jgi:two-component system OmpR family response regulator